MRSAGRCARGGHTTVTELHDLSNPGAVARVLDADPPHRRGPTLGFDEVATNHDVAASVEAEGRCRNISQPACGSFSSPPLHQAGRIKAQHVVIIWQLVGERALGELTSLLAGQDDLPHEWVGLRLVELTPANAVDLAVLLVGAEQPICFSQQVKGLFNDTNHVR
jgi:hypothetical protein